MDVQMGIVEPGVYRCSTSQWPPHPQMKFKTVLLLSPEITKNQAQTFADRQVNLIHLGLLSTGAKTGFGVSVNNQSSWRPIPDEVIKEGLQVVLNLNNHPLLICCTSGIFETGLLVGCLRKVQGWNYNSIVVEYNSWAGSKSKYAVEQFIELFDTDLVTIPQTLPNWFIKHNDKENQQNTY